MSSLNGRVLASHGRHALVEGTQGQRVLCQLSSRKLQIVCGDEVRWQQGDVPDRGDIVERLPRRSTLTRTDGAGRAETIVANLTQLIVVIAPEPAPDFFIVDRYVAAAELSGIVVLLILNKIDLSASVGDAVRDELRVFAAAGYPTLECSADSGAGIAELTRRCAGETSALVGQSGVGKSSLANRLLPGLDTATSVLSRSTAEGKHTTSVSTLHHLPGGGDLIDSPGVRDFAPAIELLSAPAQAFREIAAAGAGCRFKDCRHLKEPGCVVLAAVERGDIAPRRYESYRRLLRLSEELAPKPGSNRDRR